MKKYLLPQNGNYYKANLHTHSTVSDGGYTPEQFKAFYKEMGYSILCLTDHDLFVTHNDLTDDDFLMLNGCELGIDGPWDDFAKRNGVAKVCHINVIATSPDMETPVCWHRTKYVPSYCEHNRKLVKVDESVPDYEREYSGKGISEIMRIARENGFFVIYNHPTWSCEDYSDYMNYENMHAFEIMNSTCICGGYEEHNERVFDDMLRGGKKLFCIGADDAHGKIPMGMCYVMVNAQKLEYKTVMESLMKGDFYSSEGPEIKNLYYEDGKVTIETSDAEEIRFSMGFRVAKRFKANENETLNTATFELPKTDFPSYVRVTVTDKYGKHAYTNAYFTEDFK